MIKLAVVCKLCEEVMVLQGTEFDGDIYYEDWKCEKCFVSVQLEIELEPRQLTPKPTIGPKENL